MKFYAVIGAGLGDEGKGQTVHNLCKQNVNCLVIRYCGGPQAGHNVIHNGPSHIFANFGSGTLLNVPTYISKYCFVDPIALINERYVLNNKNVLPLIFIDPDCEIILPYDKDNDYLNHRLSNNGSCFTGIASAEIRKNMNYSIKFSDLYNDIILNIKLNQLLEHYYVDEIPNKEGFNEAIKEIRKGLWIHPVMPDISDFKTIIFEGAQGLLLDREYGFFPHVSRGNTGSKNVVLIMKDIFYQDISDSSIEYNLISRAYQTRHGQGPMTNLDIKFDINQNKNEINNYNDRQGEFRKTMLDLDLLSYSLNCDKNIRESKNKKLIITCFKDLNEFKFTHNKKIISCKNRKKFIEKIENILKINTFSYEI